MPSLCSSPYKRWKPRLLYVQYVNTQQYNHLYNTVMRTRTVLPRGANRAKSFVGYGG
jgi:hypothetical protein